MDGRIKFLFAIIKIRAENWWAAALKVSNGEVRDKSEIRQLTQSVT